MIKPTLVWCCVVPGSMTAGSLLAHHLLAGAYDMKKDMATAGGGRQREIRQSPMVLCNWLQSRTRGWSSDHQLGADTWLGHGSGEAGDRQNRSDAMRSVNKITGPESSGEGYGSPLGFRKTVANHAGWMRYLIVLPVIRTT